MEFQRPEYLTRFGINRPKGSCFTDVIPLAAADDIHVAELVDMASYLDDPDSPPEDDNIFFDVSNIISRMKDTDSQETLEIEERKLVRAVMEGVLRYFNRRKKGFKRNLRPAFTPRYQETWYAGGKAYRSRDCGSVTSSLPVHEDPILISYVTLAGKKLVDGIYVEEAGALIGQAATNIKKPRKEALQIQRRMPSSITAERLMQSSKPRDHSCVTVAVSRTSFHLSHMHIPKDAIQHFTCSPRRNPGQSFDIRVVSTPDYDFCEPESRVLAIRAIVGLYKHLGEGLIQNRLIR